VARRILLFVTDLEIGGTPTVGSWFMPSDVVALDNADKDIGSSGPMLIPGTSSVDHLQQNLAAAELSLSADVVAELDAIGKELGRA